MLGNRILDEECIKHFINEFSLDAVKNNIISIDKEYAINNNLHLFDKLDNLFAAICK